MSLCLTLYNCTLLFQNFPYRLIDKVTAIGIIAQIYKQINLRKCSDVHVNRYLFC